jgi:hypothetical protein
MELSLGELHRRRDDAKFENGSRPMCESSIIGDRFGVPWMVNVAPSADWKPPQG